MPKIKAKESGVGTLISQMTSNSILIPTKLRMMPRPYFR